MTEYARVCQSVQEYARVLPSFAKVVPNSSPKPQNPKRREQAQSELKLEIKASHNFLGSLFAVMRSGGPRSRLINTRGESSGGLKAAEISVSNLDDSLERDSNDASFVRSKLAILAKIPNNPFRLFLSVQ